VRWLVDEMFPPAVARELNDLGHDAVAVGEIGLAGAADDVIYRVAADQDRVIVTENVADFARVAAERVARGQTVVPVAFVRKAGFPRGAALSVRLARHLDRWAGESPEPYPGGHWP